MNGIGHTLLHVAAAGGHLKIMEMLIDAKANVAAKDDDGKTPLHFAARYGRVDAITYLMQVAYDLAKAKTPHEKVESDGNADEEDEDEEECSFLDSEGHSYLDEAIIQGQR